MSVVRFGVSLEKELMDILDKYVIDNKFSNRSQAIRHLINNNAVTKKWESNKLVAGSITLVFDHHKRDLVTTLTDVQHDYHNVIMSSLHFHLEHNTCMEIIAVKGQANELNELADRLIAVKGVQHGQLTMSSAD